VWCRFFLKLAIAPTLYCIGQPISISAKSRGHLRLRNDLYCVG